MNKFRRQRWQVTLEQRADLLLSRVTKKMSSSGAKLKKFV